MADACRITAVRGRRQLVVKAAADAPYVKALHAAGWSVTATPLTKPHGVASAGRQISTGEPAVEDPAGW